MKHWIPSYKKIISFILLLIVCLSVYFYILSVVLSNFKKVQNVYGDTGSDLFKKEKALKIKSIVLNNQDNLLKLDNFFLKKGEEVSFIESLEDFAVLNNLEMEINSIDTKDIGGGKEGVVINIISKGDWGNIIKFLHKLERLDVGVSVDSSQLFLDEDKWNLKIGFIVFKQN